MENDIVKKAMEDFRKKAEENDINSWAVEHMSFSVSDGILQGIYYGNFDEREIKWVDVPFGENHSLEEVADSIRDVGENGIKDIIGEIEEGEHSNDDRTVDE